jgi:hypothetical protein
MADENKVEKELLEVKRIIRKAHLQNIGWVAFMLAIALALTQVNEYRLLALAPFIIGIALLIVGCYDVYLKKWHWGLDL